MMNKKELIAAIAEKADLSLAQAEIALSATFGAIQATMAAQDTVMVPGFGSFGAKVREERKGRNPGTGQEITIPKAVLPVFKPAAQLKETVNTLKK
jgi:DNA-binding protein HU-beta